MENQDNFSLLQDMCNIARVLPNSSILNIYEKLIEIKDNEDRVSVVLSNYFSSYDPNEHSCMLDDMLKIKHVLPNYSSIDITNDLLAVKDETNRVQLVLKKYFDSGMKTTKRRLSSDNEESVENNFDKKLKTDSKIETPTEVNNVNLDSNNLNENCTDKAESISANSQIDDVTSQSDFELEDMLRVFFKDYVMGPSEESVDSNPVLQQPEINAENISDETSVIPSEEIHSNLELQQPEIKTENIFDETSVIPSKEIHSNMVLQQPEIKTENIFAETSVIPSKEIHSNLVVIQPEIKTENISDETSVISSEEINTNEKNIKTELDECNITLYTKLCNLHPNFSPSIITDVCNDLEIDLHKIANDDTLNLVTSVLMNLVENEKAYDSVQAEKLNTTFELSSFKTRQSSESDSTEILENSQLPNKTSQHEDVNECKIKTENFVSSVVPESNTQLLENIKTEKTISPSPIDESNIENFPNNSANYQPTNNNNFSEPLNLTYTYLPYVDYEMMELRNSKIKNVPTTSKVNNTKCIAIKREISVNRNINNDEQKPKIVSILALPKLSQKKSSVAIVRQKSSTSINPNSNYVHLNSVDCGLNKLGSIKKQNEKASMTNRRNQNIIREAIFKPITINAIPSTSTKLNTNITTTTNNCTQNYSTALNSTINAIPSTSTKLNTNITTTTNNCTQNYTTALNSNAKTSTNSNPNLQQKSISSTNSHPKPSTSSHFSPTCTSSSLVLNITYNIENDIATENNNDKTENASMPNIDVNKNILRVRKDIFDVDSNEQLLQDEDDVILMSVDRLPDEEPIRFTVKPNLTDLPKQEIISNNSTNKFEQKPSTSNDNSAKSTSCSSKNRSFYFKLMEMFPDICPDYLRNLCGSVQDNEESLNILISRLLTGNYKKRVRCASPVNHLDFEEQYKMLLDLFPDADPTYLQHHCERLIDQPTEFTQFVTSLVETKNYPSKENYLKKLKLSAQEKQYTTEFDVKTFVEVIPDPEQYFNDPQRKIPDGDLDYALTFLKNHYRAITVRDIHSVYRECQFSVIRASRTLDQFKRFLKTKRKLYPVTSCKNIPLLQEIAYVQHKKEILEYIVNQKLEKHHARIDAKQAGLMKTCQCCYDDEIMPDDTETCESGQHIFCKQCIRKGCEIVIGDGKVDFPCLESCKSFFTLQVLQNVLAPKVFSKMAQRKQMEEVKSAGIEDLEFCPFCDFATIPAPGDKLFRCLNNDCMKESCRLCKEPSHIPLHCDEVEKDKDVKMRTYIENKMTEALLRKCYKCGLKFIKESGCNKMTCSCGAMMCYVCNKPVKDYKHFNGQGGDKYHLCPLYSDTHKLHMDAVKQSGEAAKQELGLHGSNNQLKNDPTKNVEQYYSRLAAQNPTIPNIPADIRFQMPPFP